MSAGGRGLLSVARDTLYLGAGGAAAAALSFLAWIFLARTIPPADYGALGAAIAFVALFHTAGDLGINYLAIREGSKDPERATEVFRALAGPRLALLGLSTVACALLALALPFRSMERLLVFLYLGTVPLAGLGGFVACLCNVHRRMARLGALQAAERGAMLALVVVAVSLGSGAPGAALASAGSSLLFLALVTGATRTLSKDSVLRPAPLASARPHLPAAVQFGVAALLGTVHSRIDQVMLSLLSTAGELAAYVAAAQVFSLLLLSASALSQAAFPWLVPQLSKGELPLRRLVLWSLGLLGLGSLAAFAAGLASPALFSWLFPAAEFRRSAEVFPLLVWSFVPAVAAIPVSLALDALDLQRIHVMNAAAMASLNIFLNLLMIPGLGAAGSAWASVAAWSFGYIVGVPVGLHYLARHHSFSRARGGSAS